MSKTRTFFILSVMMVSTLMGYVRVSRAENPTVTDMKAVSQQSGVVAAENPPVIHKSGKSRDGIFSRIYLADILATLVYSLMGLAIALFGYKVYDWITPFDLRKELEIDQNTSLGIVAGAIILGLCIIVAAAIMSP